MPWLLSRVAARKACFFGFCARSVSRLECHHHHRWDFAVVQGQSLCSFNGAQDGFVPLFDAARGDEALALDSAVRGQAHLDVGLGVALDVVDVEQDVGLDFGPDAACITVGQARGM